MQLPSPVIGVLQPETVSPVTVPDSVIVTGPVNVPVSVTVMVSVALLP